jgi:TolA-binding protein
MTRPLLICLLALFATACDPAPHRQDAAAPANANGIREEVAGDLAAARLKVAEDRIAQLERQVGELQNKPEKLDLQLLTQRVEQIETRVYAKGGEPTPAPQPSGVPGKRGDAPAAATPGGNRFNPFGL